MTKPISHHLAVSRLIIWFTVSGAVNAVLLPSVLPAGNELGQTNRTKTLLKGATEETTETRIHWDPDVAGMTPPPVAGAACMAVAVPVTAPTASEDNPGPSLYLTTLVELLMRDHSPAQALCSLLAMCWMCPPSCEGEQKNLFLGSVLLGLGRLLKDKLACLAQNMADCLSCRRDGKGAKQPVTLICSHLRRLLRRSVCLVQVHKKTWGVTLAL